MVNPGSLSVALVALVAGLAVGGFGVMMMLEAGEFFSTEASQESGLLGLSQSSSQEASINTPAWVGLVLTLAGISAIGFGARGLFIAFEGRGEI